MGDMAYIRVPAGGRLSILTPQPEQVPSLRVLARALGREHRFSNMAEPDWTVLDHSLHVHRLLRMNGAPLAARRRGLGHDLTEAVLRDVASPYKREVPRYKELERILMDEAIAPKFGLEVDSWDASWVKWADLQALAIEARYCLGLDQEELADWGWYSSGTMPLDNLPWTRVLDHANDLEARYGQPDFRAKAVDTFLYLAEQEGFQNVG